MSYYQLHNCSKCGSGDMAMEIGTIMPPELCVKCQYEEEKLKEEKKMSFKEELQEDMMREQVRKAAKELTEELENSRVTLLNMETKTREFMEEKRDTGITKGTSQSLTAIDSYLEQLNELRTYRVVFSLEQLDNLDSNLQHSLKKKVLANMYESKKTDYKFEEPKQEQPKRKPKSDDVLDVIGR